MITDLLIQAGPMLEAGPMFEAGPVLLAQGGGSAEDYPFLVLLAGPVAGVLTYLGIYSRYRNKDKRYRYESEAKVDVGNMMTRDAKIQHRRRVTGRRMSGANDAQPLERVQRMQIEG